MSHPQSIIARITVVHAAVVWRADGRKVLIAIADGYRESAQSWQALDVKARGLVIDPQLATGDGALGFWKAIAQVYPQTRE